MSVTDLAPKERLEKLHQLANSALELWDLPHGASARLMNLSENATYLVEAPNGHKSVLRVHRESYHTRRAIECELAWIDALAAETDVVTPEYFVGRNGSAIQCAKTTDLPQPRFLVMFDFLEGEHPDETSDMTAGYTELGVLAAQCHLHAISWNRPTLFERLTWDTETVFGASPTWGDWRDAPHVTADVRDVLERVETAVCARLEAYGKSENRYNLIHADMRLANLLISKSGTRLIDFDDCGFGWFMYDFAAAISFIEDDPNVPSYKAAWLTGYQTVRPLSQEDIAEIDTLVMLRRMALLAWIGSHLEAPEPQALAPDFARTTADLGQAWLDSLSQDQ